MRSMFGGECRWIAALLFGVVGCSSSSDGGGNTSGAAGQAGSAAAAAGSGGAGGSSSGGGTSGSTGTGEPKYVVDPGAYGWSCANTGTTLHGGHGDCTCIPALRAVDVADNCATPKPTCCYEDGLGCNCTEPSTNFPCSLIPDAYPRFETCPTSM